MHVEVYGGYHSPWVQALLLGLHDRKIEHSVTAVPPLENFLSDGVTMPAARIEGAAWKYESIDLLKEIGCSDVSEEEMQHVNASWQGVLHRADNIGNFWGAFSQSGDQNRNPFLRLIKNFLRSFITLYFYLLIRTINLVASPQEPENYGDQFLYFNDRLHSSGKPFLDGDEPNSLDYLLFGIIQCHCSIYVDPVTALQTDDRLPVLRAWIGRMHERFDDYPYLYSGVYLQPHRAPPAVDNGINRLAFWLGGISMIAIFYITIPLIAFLAIRKRRN